MNDRPLAWALRLFGALDVMAAVAVFLPRDLMATITAWSGLSPLPSDPVVGYLARSGSLMYVLHGITILYVSGDIPRYRGLIRFLAWAALVHGAVLYAIDWYEGMPVWWKMMEGGCVAATGIVVLSLLEQPRSSVEEPV